MRIPTYADAFKVLLLQVTDEGRGDVLFGDSVARAREAVPPFIVGEKFPDVYLEHPLVGAPFLDVTVLLRQLNPGARIASDAAGEHGALLDWYAGTSRDYPDISFGFELDTKEEVLPLAGVHFQPRDNIELVRPFCETVGEPWRADLYLDLAQRMPKGWPLSFFGMFRGRAASPLRVCGYMSDTERAACASDPSHLADSFDAIGFHAYDEPMLTQVSELMAAVPRHIDFQFDVFPDGSLGPTFAIDAQFDIEQPHKVRETFETGVGASVMGILERWGAADGRWKMAIKSAFARSIPVVLDDSGEIGFFAFTLIPQWAKARWTNAVLQPAKLYHLAHAGLLEKEDVAAKG